MYKKIILLLCISMNAFAETKIDSKSLTSIDLDAFEALSSVTDRPKSKELLKQLQEYESYRPTSFSDATRNPFGRIRYKFFDDE